MCSLLTCYPPTSVSYSLVLPYFLHSCKLKAGWRPGNEAMYCICLQYNVHLQCPHHVPSVLQFLFTQELYDKPLFTVYFKTALFTIYLVAFLFWRPWQRLCKSGRGQWNERRRVAGPGSVHSQVNHYCHHWLEAGTQLYYVCSLPMACISLGPRPNQPQHGSLLV